MSQRNPTNERYTAEGRTGKTRKSAASAKPKMKVAATVVPKAAKKTKQQKKAEAKAERKKQQATQRELDRKYYTPDTPRYRKLRKMWWGCLIGGIICVAISFAARDQMPPELAIGILFAAYALIIGAFYIDLSKIRKERQAYQRRMVLLEEAEAKKQKAEQRAHGGKGKAAAKGAAAAKPEGEGAEGASEAAEPAKKRRGFFGNGFRLPKEKAAPASDAESAAEDGNEETAEPAGT